MRFIQTMAKQYSSSNNLNILVSAGFIFQLAIINVCGSQCLKTGQLGPLSLEGTPTLRGECPFLAALYRVDDMEFFCAGTLISTKHVLTAAHCVQAKYAIRKLLPLDVSVLLGAYNLSSKVERGVRQREVDEIHVHPDWEVFSGDYDADIAIFVLSENVLFTHYIGPVCMPSDDDYAEGVNVGWGWTENGKRALEYPSHSLTNIFNASFCLKKSPSLGFRLSSRTFCGVTKNGLLNKGNSGGGLFKLTGSGYIWEQYGVISSLRVNETDSFSVYTKVNLFKNWIYEIVNKSECSVMTEMTTEAMAEVTTEAMTEVTTEAMDEEKFSTYECAYADTYAHDHDATKYTCLVNGLNVQNENVEAASFTGSHSSGYTNLDVEKLKFDDGTMLYLPGGIGKVFPNLESFIINSGLHFMRLKRSNFKNLENLSYFQCFSNEVDTIDPDTLWDLPNLQEFYFFQNKVKDLDKNFFNIFFEKNTKLRKMSFSYNKLEFLPKDTFKNNLLLEEVSFNGDNLKIIEIDFSQLPNIHQIFSQRNDCFDGYYDDYDGEDYHREYQNRYKNFTDFLNVIRDNCNSPLTHK